VAQGEDPEFKAQDHKKEKGKKKVFRRSCLQPVLFSFFFFLFSLSTSGNHMLWTPVHEPPSWVTNRTTNLNWNAYT
jgi:hypothetical protein